MTLHIPLTQDSEARLRELAAASGKDVPTVIAEAIEEKLAAEAAAMADRPPPRSAEEWVAELREWAASHPRIEHFVDDSRESIYAGRGE